MDSLHGMSPELREALAAPEAPRSGGSLFTSHGIWAPGVALMRNLNFAAKASLISLLFLVPLLLSGFFLARDLQAAIDFSRKERVGIELLRVFSPVQKGVAIMRASTRATMGGYAGADASFQAGRQMADQGIKDFEARLTATGDTLGLRQEFDRFRDAWAKAQPSRGPTGDTGYGDVSRTMVPLLRKMGDQSALVLDPDIESLYMVLAFVVSTPKLVDDINQVWGWSAGTLSSRQIDEVLTRRYAVWQSGVLNGSADIRDSLGRSMEALPSLKEQLPLKNLDQLDAYQKQIQDPAQLLAQGMPANEAFGLGERALNGVFELYDTGLDALDAVILQRLVQAESKRNTIAVLVGLSVALAVYFFYSFFLVTRGGLRLISQHLQEMAEGDLRKAPGQPWARTSQPW